MNTVIESLMNHRSVRRFNNRTIEPEILNTVLTAGMHAATGGNLQQYSFIVIDDKNKMIEIDEELEVPFLQRSNCPVAILALADQFRIRNWLKIHSNQTFVNNSAYSFFMSMWDALIALQNVVIAAESMELGTCYIGGGIELNIQKIFNAPELVFPAGFVCIGYPETSPGLSQRLPLDAIVHHNSYKRFSNDDINSMYKTRDSVWEKVSQSRRDELAKQGIGGIAEAISVQKFSPELVEKRSRGIIHNLLKSGFDIRPTD